MTLEKWLDSLSVLEINFITTYIAKSEIYPITNKNRNHHGFIYTVKGSETYTFEESSIVAVPNSVLYLPKGSKYKVTLKGEESVVIYVDFEMQEFSPRAPFCIKFEDDKSVLPLFTEAEKECNKKSGDCQSACKSLFYKICSRMIRKREVYMDSRAYAKIVKSLNYLHLHYMENSFRISTLYRIANVSSRYYEKLFFQKLGVTPKEYILKLKMEYAKELLLSEKIPINDIALKLGYGDIYHFGKIFKKKTGYTPGQYRKNAPLTHPPKIAKMPTMQI